MKSYIYYESDEKKIVIYHKLANAIIIKSQIGIRIVTLKMNIINYNFNKILCNDKAVILFTPIKQNYYFIDLIENKEYLCNNKYLEMDKKRKYLSNIVICDERMYALPFCGNEITVSNVIFNDGLYGKILLENNNCKIRVQGTCCFDDNIFCIYHDDNKNDKIYKINIKDKTEQLIKIKDYNELFYLRYWHGWFYTQGIKNNKLFLIKFNCNFETCGEILIADNKCKPFKMILDGEGILIFDDVANYIVNKDLDSKKRLYVSIDEYLNIDRLICDELKYDLNEIIDSLISLNGSMVENREIGLRNYLSYITVKNS